MKKELRKHKNSNVIESDLRNLTRNVFRKQPIDMVLDKGDGTGVQIEGLQVSPQFAALTEKIMKGRAETKNERLKAMLEMTEIWQPPTPTIEEQKEDNKKKSSFVNDEKKVKKPRKPRKKTKKLEVTFVPDKKLGLDIIFESDITIEDE